MFSGNAGGSIGGGFPGSGGVGVFPGGGVGGFVPGGLLPESSVFKGLAFSPEDSCSSGVSPFPFFVN